MRLARGLKMFQAGVNPAEPERREVGPGRAGRAGEVGPLGLVIVGGRSVAADAEPCGKPARICRRRTRRPRIVQGHLERVERAPLLVENLEFPVEASGGEDLDELWPDAAELGAPTGRPDAPHEPIELGQ